jgi:IS1 family transposase
LQADWVFGKDSHRRRNLQQQRSSNWLNSTPSWGRKKELYLMKAVDRATRCIVGSRIESTRVFEVLQSMVDQAAHADHYFSDGFPCYSDVYYHGPTYQAMPNNVQTYSVEGVIAEFRHYLERLHRSTRCYSKCANATRCAVSLFVSARNRRQSR